MLIIYFSLQVFMGIALCTMLQLKAFICLVAICMVLIEHSSQTNCLLSIIKLVSGPSCQHQIVQDLIWYVLLWYVWKLLFKSWTPYQTGRYIIKFSYHHNLQIHHFTMSSLQRVNCKYASIFLSLTIPEDFSSIGLSIFSRSLPIGCFLLSTMASQLKLGP